MCSITFTRFHRQIHHNKCNNIITLSSTPQPSTTFQRHRKRSTSSQSWLQRQSKDPHVQKAQALGLPSRAYFKLQQINETLLSAATKTPKRRLIQSNMRIVDLGAAPGGWSIYASTQLDPTLGGAVVAVDLLPLSPEVLSRMHRCLGDGFCFLEGDFTGDRVRREILEAFAASSGSNLDSNGASIVRVDLILSDMAANFTGDSLTDAIRTMNLCEKALAFAAGDGCFDASREDGDGRLRKGGSFLTKYFSCGVENERELMEAARRVFRSVHVLKPKSSRRESSEVYLLGFDKKH